MDSQMVIEKFVADDNEWIVRPDLDLARERLFLLNEPERIFMEQYLEHGLSCRNIALLTGLDRRAVGRKVSRLLNVLVNKGYIKVYARRRALDEPVLDIAYDHMILGLGYRALAVKYKIPQYRIRKTLQAIYTITLSKNKGTIRKDHMV